MEERIGVNTGKILNEKFVDKSEFPIWYYKELVGVEIDYLIWNLLKESFVVEIHGLKYKVTFGVNKEGEIGQCIQYDDMKKSNLTSYEVIQKGFKEGKWFIISTKDTSGSFKLDYKKRKEQYKKRESMALTKLFLSSMK